MTECGGNRALAAEVLGIAQHDLSARIRKNPELKALWSNSRSVHGNPAPEAKTVEVMNRRPKQMSDLTPESVELAQMVSESDNELLRKGLKKLGVSDKMVERLKTLDGLARSSGHFLSISLEKTHRLYFLQLIGLNEVADELRARLLAKPDEPGWVAGDEERAFLNRNYSEMVKEAGNGYKIMMEGAANMVRMLAAAKGNDDPTGPTGKPKWGRVNEPKAVDPTQPPAE